MLYNNFTEELLGLQDVKVTNIEKNDEEITIYIELNRIKSEPLAKMDTSYCRKR